MIDKIKKIYDTDYMIEMIKKETDLDDENQIMMNICFSHNSLQNYLNAKEEQMLKDGKARFSFEVLQLSIYITKEASKEGIASKSQGERSISYFNNYKIPDYIKLTLPLPYARSLYVL